MADNYQELVDEIYSDKTPADTTPAETTPAETTPAETPNPAEEPKPADTTPADTTPAETPNPAEPKKPSEHTPQERAEFAFKRQLAKQREKYEAQLKEQSDKFANLQKQLDELKKAQTPKTVLKREDFPDDEEFIRALQQEEIQKALEARDAKRAEEAQKKAEQDAQAEKEKQELEQQQQVWIDNVSTAFNGDETRKSNFFKRVQYCQQRGLGEILDKVPVAADFLMYNPRGPIVFERMLNDRASFERVFNERVTNPMDIYYELRRLDEAIAAEKPAEPQAPQTQTPQTPQATVPHLGKPGKQSASNTKPDIFNDDDEMLKYLRTR